MEQHNCVRNPESGCCYVCHTPMRKNFGASLLDSAIEQTEDPRPVPALHLCACGKVVKANETQCVDCWIADQTKQAAPKPKPVKQTRRQASTTGIDLESILAATLETNPNKWN